MTRFIAVVHHWFVHSKGFTVTEIEAKDDAEAWEKSEALAHRLDVPFNKTAAQLVHIGDNEILLPRRLTWRERLTGRLGERPISVVFQTEAHTTPPPPKKTEGSPCLSASRSIIDAAEANIREDYRGGKISKEQFQREILIVTRARQQAVADTPTQTTAEGSDG